MENEQNKIWFHAKRYGFGWGLPASWEGWIVFTVYLAIIIGGPFIMPIMIYPVAAILATGILFVILFKKGEKLAWRFGDKDKFSTKQIKTFSILAHLLMSPLILAMGIWMYCSPPRDIGNIGYRTPASMQDDITWDEAQRYSSRLMIIAGVVTLIYQAISFVIMKPEASLISSALVMVMAVMLVIPITEYHLKNFDPDPGTKIYEIDEP